MIDLKNLKSLIRLMVENDLTELDLKDAAGEAVTLKRGSAHGGPGGGQPHVQYIAAPPTHAAAPAAAHSSSGAGAAAGGADPGLKPIPSPMVGTFYAAANPESKPFIAVGDRVDPDTVVCIIEAMKVFNEIKAEMSGVVEKIAVTNGQSVEFGQPLFMVRAG